MPSFHGLRVRRDKIFHHFKRRHTDPPPPAPAATSTLPSTASTVATSAPTRTREASRTRLAEETFDSTREPTPELSRSETSRQTPSLSTRRDSTFTQSDPRQVDEAAKLTSSSTTTTDTTTVTPTTNTIPIAIDTAAASSIPQAASAASDSPASTAVIVDLPTVSQNITETEGSRPFPPAVETVSVQTGPVTTILTTLSTPSTVPNTPNTPISPTTRPAPQRKQSIFQAHEIPRIANHLRIKGGLTLPEEAGIENTTGGSALSPAPELRYEPEMVNGKVWVRRRDGSPTLVDLKDDDLVDNLRDAILRKYQNALGKHYDAPDIQLKIVPRGGGGNMKREERLMSPDEFVVRALDDCYPGGQTVAEALIIDVPQPRERKTPRPSPNQPYYYGGYGHETLVGAEGNEYFPPMPQSSTSHPTNNSSSNISNSQIVLSQPSISILTTGQVAAVPASPGQRRLHNTRPSMRPRMNTSSPTVHTNQVNGTTTPIVLMPRGARSRGGSDASGSNQNQQVPAAAPPLPTPPIMEESIPQQQTTTVSSPPARVASPRPLKLFKEKQKPPKPTPAGLLDGTVPPINVLIVEDNIINLKLLEAFMKRLKVRWQSAMNGREAVVKWRSGGFHLVLMDIQLPVMSGLEATKEIRRLERVNGIGVFSQTPGSKDEESQNTEVPEEDKLSSTIMFKSPVIIVALTASSLQSDRHEALAAGCNDFLTKPVNFIWLEKKVTEWGCMQALIDFDGWRKWKDYSQNTGEEAQEKKGRPGRINAKRDRQRSGQASAVSTPTSTTPGHSEVGGTSSVENSQAVVVG